MKRYSHKYIFYLYPVKDKAGTVIKKSVFAFFGRVKDGKEFATGREYDYKKIF